MPKHTNPKDILKASLLKKAIEKIRRDAVGRVKIKSDKSNK